MVAPVFTSIDPAIGHPGGKYLVVIQGTDFQLHPEPAPTGQTSGVLEPSMEVEIDGRQAESVRVYTSTKLTCLVPVFKGSPSLLTTGHDVDLVLRNLGPPQEEVTEVDGFQFKRVGLARGDNAGVLNRIVRELIQELRRQVVNNVAIATHIDYDSSSGDGLNIVEVAEAPGIALFGPGLRENKFYRTAEKPQDRDVPGQEYTKYRTPATDDIFFTVVLIGKDDPTELFNLMQEFRLFFRNTTSFEMDAHPTDPSYGTIDLELWLTDGPRATGEANRDNLYLARAAFEIRGVPLDEDDRKRVEWGTILDDPADIVVSTQKE